MKYKFFGGPRCGEEIDVPEGPVIEFPRPIERELFDPKTAPTEFVRASNDRYEGQKAGFPGGERALFFEHERIGRERQRIDADRDRMADIRYAQRKVKYLRNAPKALNFDQEIAACEAVIEQKLTGLTHSIQNRREDFEAEEKDRLARIPRR